ncbi:MAG: thioredoxin family protein [Pirellulales bacterium]|nr:thioredoxin family protein [Pirellulales bacterium]
MRCSRMNLLLILVAAMGFAAPASAAAPQIGDPAPAFSGLIGTDDQKHGLTDYKDAELIVLVFTCNHCPVAKAYEDRLVALQKDYKDKNVQLVAVNCNNLPADRLEPMKKRAKAKGFNFPYLYDSSQKTGVDYGAKVTPHAFVLDKNRNLAYVGAIDDNMTAKKAEKHYVRDALDALLDGKQPPKTETKAVGCSIKYEKKKMNK